MTDTAYVDLQDADTPYVRFTLDGTVDAPGADSIAGPDFNATFLRSDPGFARFNGNGQQFRIPTNAGWNTASMTFECWLWIDSSNTGHVDHFFIRGNDVWTHRLGDASIPGEVTNQLVCAVVVDGGTTHVIRSPEALPTEQWIHIAHTYQSGQHLLYLNGQIVASEPLHTGSIRSDIDPVWVGSWGGGGYYKGGMAYPAFYKSVLPAARIRARYEHFLPPPLRAIHGGVQGVEGLLSGIAAGIPGPRLVHSDFFGVSWLPSGGTYTVPSVGQAPGDLLFMAWMRDRTDGGNAFFTPPAGWSTAWQHVLSNRFRSEAYYVVLDETNYDDTFSFVFNGGYDFSRWLGVIRGIDPADPVVIGENQGSSHTVWPIVVGTHPGSKMLAIHAENENWPAPTSPYLDLLHYSSPIAAESNMGVYMDTALNFPVGVGEFAPADIVGTWGSWASHGVVLLNPEP